MISPTFPTPNVDQTLRVRTDKTKGVVLQSAKVYNSTGNSISSKRQPIFSTKNWCNTEY